MELIFSQLSVLVELTSVVLVVPWVILALENVIPPLLVVLVIINHRWDKITA